MIEGGAERGGGRRGVGGGKPAAMQRETIGSTD